MAKRKTPAPKASKEPIVEPPIIEAVDAADLEAPPERTRAEMLTMRQSKEK